MGADTSHDAEYLKLLLEPLEVSTGYQPMFGHGKKGGLSLAEFQTLYQADPFYSWMGLDSPLMYAAHKAAGGMTSIYRQIGIGCQWIFQHSLRDYLGLDEAQSNWSYKVPKGAKQRTLTLDGRIDVGDVADVKAKARVTAWLDAAKKRADVPAAMGAQLKGAVFEVRQGYKSKDSKRQNADIANAVSAYTNFYLPAVVLLSTQIDDAIAERYQAERWLLLTGMVNGATTESTYAFCREVVGYDLAAFFERNSRVIKSQIETILKAILTA